MQTTLQDYCGTATTYVVALLTMLGTLVSDNYTFIVQLLGFILLVARLVQELPRAATVIVKTFSRRTVVGNTVTTVDVKTTTKKTGANV